MSNAPFPRLVRLKQHFAVPPPVDLHAALGAEFEKVRRRIKPGARVALAVGSRGITHLARIVAALLDLLKSAGAQPFIVPAMGSHGGATATGQTELLGEYGITAAQLQVPVRAAMDVIRLGTTEAGFDVFCSTEALNADGIILVNRIKPHTDFESDSLGSGLLKMLVVGLGKHQGAAAYHAAAARLGYENVTRTAAQIVLRTAPILGGVGIVENQVHGLAHIAVIPADDLERCEAELFAPAKRLMPGLPFAEIDLLIVDRIGKNISGTGMDPNVIGRHIHGYSSQLAGESKSKPLIRRIFVRELTPETHGNGLGIGLADFTTTRLVRALDLRKTYLNVLTSLSLNGAKIPIHFESDREVLTHALSTLAMADAAQAKVVRIQDTLSLEVLAASEACLPAVAESAALEPLGAPEAMQFDEDGNLLP